MEHPVQHLHVMSPGLLAICPDQCCNHGNASLNVATQVYFTTYEKLKAKMKKRQGMPQPIQHMVSAVGAGKKRLKPAFLVDPTQTV